MKSHKVYEIIPLLLVALLQIMLIVIRLNGTIDSWVVALTPLWIVLAVPLATFLLATVLMILVIIIEIGKLVFRK